MASWIGGMDEAGRGPALGPLVMALVVLEKEQEEALQEAGVKDSKLLPPGERERLATLIRKEAVAWEVCSVHPAELNRLMAQSSLNEIEAMKAGHLLQAIGRRPALVFVDSPDTPADRFSRRIKKYLPFPLVIRAEHKADYHYPVVGAASILAKVERDSKMKELEREFGSVGSGYSSDPVTIRFLEDWVSRNKSLPSCARTFWETNERILSGVFQKRLEEF